MGDQLLKFARKVGGVRNRAIDVRVSKNGPAHRDTASSRSAAGSGNRNSSMALVNVDGRSRLERCAASIFAMRAPGIYDASTSPWPVQGVDTSASPPMTSVGTWIAGNSGRLSMFADGGAAAGVSARSVASSVVRMEFAAVPAVTKSDP
jgi:hypothetical protein